MSFSDWVPALTSTVFLSAAASLFAVFYKAAVEKGVQHVLDAELETIRSKLRTDEETFRAALRARDDQIAALRTSALSNMANRQGYLDRRRAEAVERLWGEVVEMSRLRLLVQSLGLLKIEAAFEAVEKGRGEGIQAFAKALLDQAGIADELKFSTSANKERPFIDAVSWSLFVAHRHLHLLPAIIFSL